MKRTLHLFLCCLIPFIISGAQPSGIPGLEIPYIKASDDVVKHLGYTLSYNEQHEQANWVAYELTAEETRKAVERSDDFRPDPRVQSGTATSNDYQGSGYDRGHLAPAADMGWSTQAMRESFYFSNMSPQVPGFNRGIWKKLEEQVRRWATDYQAIYVVTGPVLHDSLPAIGPENVSVPAAYYKVILDYTQPGLKAIGFIMPNASSTLPLQHYAVSIDSVETVTGIDFFPALPDHEEEALEKTICLRDWSWTVTPTATSPAKATGIKTRQCSAITQSGQRCKRQTTNASGRCVQHAR